MSVHPAKSTHRAECWIDRDSLLRWIADRDLELKGYMERADAKQALGLTSTTLMSLARAGLIRFVQGPERGFTSGTYFSRQDLETIKTAFRVPVNTKGVDRASHISLRDAQRTVLSRKGLVSLLRATINGEVFPTRKTESIPGIMGWMYLLADVRRFRPAAVLEAIPSGCMTYKTAAEMIGTNTEVVRNMVVHRILRQPRGRVAGPKLVRSEDVERFSDEFISVVSIAENFSTTSSWVSRYLRENGTKVLVVKLPGKGNKLFVPKQSVAGIQIPLAKRAKAVPTRE